MNDRTDDVLRLRATLASIAPGTSLRDGLERILRGRTGALLVLGSDKVVDSISTGGFFLDVPFTATGLRELVIRDYLPTGRHCRARARSPRSPARSG